jgi:hypothetical protein
LQQLADYPVRLGQVAFEQEDRAGLRERVGEGRAGDAGADDDDLGGEVVQLA